MTLLAAEEVDVPERLVTAPRAGIFVSTGLAPGEQLTVGQSLGAVLSMGEEHDIQSPFAGTLMGLLAHPGERLRPNQPVAWLTTHS